MDYDVDMYDSISECIKPNSKWVFQYKLQQKSITSSDSAKYVERENPINNVFIPIEDVMFETDSTSSPKRI